MRNSSHFTRPVIIAATALSLAASPAMARPADQPLHVKVPATRGANHSRPWTQARVDSAGVRPAERPVVTAAPAVPLTRAADTTRGTDWLPITIVASTMLALLAIAALARPVGHRAHAFRARRI